MCCRRESGSRVSSDGSTEEENEGFRFVYFIMCPTSGLLYPKGSPFMFCEESASRHLFVDMLGQENVSVFKKIVLILLGVFNFIRKMGHFFAVVFLKFKMLTFEFKL